MNRLFNVETLNRLSIECHERANDKGFWDAPHSIGHHLMLAFGELHEAIEADRLGKWAKLTPEQIELLRVLNGAAFAQAFQRMVKDSVEDEISDAVIRLLDLLGWLLKIRRTTELLTESDLNRVVAVLYMTRPDEELTLLLLRIVADTSGYWRFGHLRDKGIFYAIKSLEQLSDHFGIDLMTHIDLKMRYNSTRPHLHGKKY
nr:hypothetical protein [uncultured Porphyromonas sp.]